MTQPETAPPPAGRLFCFGLGTSAMALIERLKGKGWHFGGTVAGQFFGEVRPGTLVQFDGAAEYLVSPEGIVSARHIFDFTGALVTAGVLRVRPI